MKKNKENTADLIGRQAFLTTFVEEVVRSSPDMAASILMNIKELTKNNAHLHNAVLHYVMHLCIIISPTHLMVN
ncbi:hypothetical protein [Acinetobacter baumannii]|uniref:hypothetical protein n=1 Tax=Acinetobacter baumannii TaxID=470 RepID=UPI003857FB14